MPKERPFALKQFLVPPRRCGILRARFRELPPDAPAAAANRALRAAYFFRGPHMPKNVLFPLAAWLCLPAVGLFAAEAKPRVIIFNGAVTEVAAGPEESKDLWISPKDLTRATKFELKPQGVCLAQLCFPIPEARKQEFLAQRGGATWFNLSEFARLLHQPSAHDAKHAVWYFGPRPEEQNGYLKTLAAPDFTLPDLDGKKHAIADFRGKKVLLITWASW